MDVLQLLSTRLIFAFYVSNGVSSSPISCPSTFCEHNVKREAFYMHKSKHYTIFIRIRYGNVPFWPTVYTVPFSYPASNEDYCIREYLSVYTMPFS